MWLAQVGCSRDFRVRRGAPSILAALAGPTPEEAVALATDEFDANKRFQGLSLLAGESFAGQDVYVALFARSLGDADPGVRSVAARALGVHGRAEHAAKIAPLLKDADTDVRIDAARALQRLHDPQVIPALFDALDPAKEEEPRVREAAATALGQYRQATVVERLIAAMNDADLVVNTRVRESLIALTGMDYGFSRRDWQAWYRQTPSALAAGGGYTFPVFQRDRRWYEYIPLVPQPPNETRGVPAGWSPLGG